MQVTINIPEPLYRRLEIQAEAGLISLEELVLHGASQIAADGPAEASYSKAQKGELSLIVKMGINVNDFLFRTDEEIDEIEKALAEDPEAAMTKFNLSRLDDSH